MTQLYASVPQTDPLQFWSEQGVIDYSKISELLELGKSDLSKIGQVSQSTVRLDNRIPAQLKDRLEQIAVICTLVAEHFDGDTTKTVLWFRTPNPSLGYISPRDMIRFGRYRKLMKFVQNAREANNVSA